MRWSLAVAAMAFSSVALSSVALVTGPPASAAGAKAAPGTITTIAGGVGGPAKATKVALFEPCAVTTAGGFGYVSDFSGAGLSLNTVTTPDAVIRRISTRTGARRQPGRQRGSGRDLERRLGERGPGGPDLRRRRRSAR